jgi:hypothetical protein
MRPAATETSGAKQYHAARSALEPIEEVKPLVPEITIPTLIIRGKLDTEVERFNAVWLHRRPGATHKALPSLPDPTTSSRWTAIGNRSSP